MERPSPFRILGVLLAAGGAALLFENKLSELPLKVR